MFCDWLIVLENNVINLKSKTTSNTSLPLLEVKIDESLFWGLAGQVRAIARTLPLGGGGGG